MTSEVREKRGSQSKRKTQVQKPSALHVAVKMGYLQKVKRLLETGADPDEAHWSESGFRLPLFDAVLSGNLAIVRLLLASGCAVDTSNPQGETALHLAASATSHSPFDPEIVRALLDAGANPGLPERVSGNTVLHILVGRHGQWGPETDQEPLRHPIIKAVQWVAASCGTAINATNLERSTALHLAVASAAPNARGAGVDGADLAAAERLRVLIEAGADVDVRDRVGGTALHLAADARLNVAAEVLLTAGADNSATDRYLATPLHYAASKNCVLIARLLLTAGANANAVDLNGDTALHLAAAKGYTTLVRLLVANQTVRPHMTNRWGALPIHAAIESGFVDVVRELLKASEGGAAVLMANTGGFQLSPLDLACTGSVFSARPEISQLLLRAVQDDVDECEATETSI